MVNYFLGGGFIEEIKKDTQQKDTQHRAWQITINNPEDKGYTHEVIKQKLDTLSTVDYTCMCDEIGGETHTYHTHIYIHCTSGMRFSTIKNLFNEAHIDFARGSPRDNRDYITKSGKWEDTEKHNTNLKDTFEEYGNIPEYKQGKRTDLTAIYEMVEQGCDNAEIMKSYPDLSIKYMDKINRLRLEMQIAKYQSEIRTVTVNYVFGATGTGKSRTIIEEHGAANVYRVTDYEHMFDLYMGQPVLVFEEFRSSVKMQDMLNYLDIYPIALPARYTNKWAMFTTVYIVSNWRFEQQYEDLQKDINQTETYAAFMRRINGVVKYYKSQEEIIVYNTLGNYFNRPKEWSRQELTEMKQEKLPFD